MFILRRDKSVSNNNSTKSVMKNTMFKILLTRMSVEMMTADTRTWKKNAIILCRPTDL